MVRLVFHYLAVASTTSVFLFSGVQWANVSPVKIGCLIIVVLLFAGIVMQSLHGSRMGRNEVDEPGALTKPC